jgi:hypothetical protein
MDPPVWTDPPLADARFCFARVDFNLYAAPSHLFSSPFQAFWPIQDGRFLLFLTSISISERRLEPFPLKIFFSSNSSSGRQATFFCNISTIYKLTTSLKKIKYEKTQTELHVYINEKKELVQGVLKY